MDFFKNDYLGGQKTEKMKNLKFTGRGIQALVPDTPCRFCSILPQRY
jgi:hypothetical protein